MSCESRKILRMMKRASNNLPINIYVDRNHAKFSSRIDVSFTKYFKFEDQSYFPYMTELDSLLAYLREENYIERIHGRDEVYRLKQKGLHNVQYAIWSVLRNVLVPALVSIAVSLIVNALTKS